jgi:hypothetical protein
MHQRPKRRFFTPAESAEIWDRWQRGEGLKSIGRVFGKTSPLLGLAAARNALRRRRECGLEVDRGGVRRA